MIKHCSRMGLTSAFLLSSGALMMSIDDINAAPSLPTQMKEEIKLPDHAPIPTPRPNTGEYHD